ncbi:hypothetical protein VNO77_27671 [Canavalia gladiata]|uniref:Uncharacterized protein n=1 Tax=Canavalia gladiata TaxID=3824 RepID=A0AAN9KXQ2_CANGL
MPLFKILLEQVNIKVIRNLNSNYRLTLTRDFGVRSPMSSRVHKQNQIVIEIIRGPIPKAVLPRSVTTLAHTSSYGNAQVEKSHLCPNNKLKSAKRNYGQEQQLSACFKSVTSVYMVLASAFCCSQVKLETEWIWEQKPANCESLGLINNINAYTWCWNHIIRSATVATGFSLPKFTLLGLELVCIIIQFKWVSGLIHDCGKPWLQITESYLPELVKQPIANTDLGPASCKSFFLDHFPRTFPWPCILSFFG